MMNTALKCSITSSDNVSRERYIAAQLEYGQLLNHTSKDFSRT